MKRLLAIIGTVPLVLLAACGDDDDSASATVPSATTEAATTSGSTSAGGASAATLKVVDVEGMGKVLATPDGMVLYFNDQDTADGSVLCDKSCADEWPPLTVSGTPMGDGVSGLATADRPDGTKQVTYDGHRLYTFNEDSAPMKATGDGAADDFDGQHFTWHAATADEAAGANGSGTATTIAGSGQSSSTPSTTGY
jgi:predicted lipoprotein with Yx(FWY)xxD motif